MTDCAEELLPQHLYVFFVCECGQMTSGPMGCLKSLRVKYSYQPCYPGVKLRCSKPHEIILAWDKSGISRDNFIPAIKQG